MKASTKVGHCQPKNYCRLCASSKLVDLVNFGETPAANAYRQVNDKSPVLVYPLRVKGCPDCGHVQLGHVVDPVVLFTNYKYASGTSESFRKHFEDYAIALIMAGVKKVLEVGANDATLLRQLGIRGVLAIGIDPAAELAGPSGGNNYVIKGFFDHETLAKAEAVLGSSPFDTLVGNNVFAHIDDLAGVFAMAHHAEIENVVFEVQSEQALLAGGMFDLCYHEHLDYHSVPPLFNALPRWGYFITRVDKVPTHGGSLRVWASRSMCGAAQPSGDLRALLCEEANREERFNKWINFGPTMDTIYARQNLENELSKYPRVACYGAPAKLTTFAHVMLKNVENIEYVVDDAKEKVGLMTPDGRWLIRASDAILDPSLGTVPDAVLITAWNFAKPIEQKLRAGGFKGPIITPFPTLEVHL